jgi:hypothetical protein
MLTICLWSSNGAVIPPFKASRSELASESSSCHEVALGGSDPLELRLPNSFPYSSLLHENTLAKLRELPRCFPRSPGQKWLVATSSCHEVALGDSDPLEAHKPFSSPYSSPTPWKHSFKLCELPRCFPRSPGQKWLVATSSCHWSLLATLTLWKRTSLFFSPFFVPFCRRLLTPSCTNS